jgi:hypothetical protein
MLNMFAKKNPKKMTLYWSSLTHVWFHSVLCDMLAQDVTVYVRRM